MQQKGRARPAQPCKDMERADSTAGQKPMTWDGAGERRPGWEGEGLGPCPPSLALPRRCQGIRVDSEASSSSLGTGGGACDRVLARNQVGLGGKGPGDGERQEVRHTGQRTVDGVS